MIDNLIVPISLLKKKCDISLLDFSTTEEIQSDFGLIGQLRAKKAMEFGLSINRKGYNIYVSGVVGTGRSSYSEIVANDYANNKKLPDDWCYVYNFKKPDNPIAIKLENSKGKIFKNDIKRLIRKIKIETYETFKSKEYEDKKDIIYRQFDRLTDEIIDELNEIAIKYNFKFQESDNELISYPLKDNKPMTEEELRELTDEEIDIIKRNSVKLNSEAYNIINKLKSLDLKLKNRIKKLKENAAYDLVNTNLSKLIKKYNDNKEVIKYLNEIKYDIVKNIDNFIKKKKKSNNSELINNDDFFDRYEINLLIDNSELRKGPVIKEVNPNYYNLFGKIEYINNLGNLKTDHTKIKPGSIHEANGGYLIINVKDLLLSSYSWEGLKRALMSDEIKIENINKTNVLAECIKPDSIPLDIKIILVGDNRTYQLLYYYDEDFKKLFRIRADFDDEIERTSENIKKISYFISKVCEDKSLKCFNKSAIARIIEYSSKTVEDKNKLTARFNDIVELMYEADTIADIDNSEHVSGEHIKMAILEKCYRNNKYEEKGLEYIKNGNILIETSGFKIGEINGLTVIDLGQYSFGRPCKITASTFVGRDGIINIEREVEQSGSIHDKGVHILNGFLGGRFARTKPLSLSCSITFEQTYGMVDGDSASSTELYSIISSLAELPINQGIAVTGSVNQKGMIQPIGGVNEKIEGYFKTCKEKGFKGGEGVIIPFQNISNLMLDDEVIESVENGTFTIYAVKTIDEGIEILTGVEAGTLDKNNKYKKGTVNYLVQKKLDSYASYFTEYE